MTKPLLIKLPVFDDYVISVEVVPNIEKALTRYSNVFAVKEWGGEERTSALTVFGNWISYIFLRPRSSAGTIAHESLHAITDISDKTGMELNDESAAYHLGYIVDKIDRYMKRRGR